MKTERMDHPNILLILTDQLRKTSLGCYGNPDAQTPVIDGICRDGLRFDNSVSSAPVCAPYRTTLQSGLYPHQHGVRGNGDLFRPCFKGLAEYFNEAGYETCFVGKSHFGRDEIEEKDGWVRPENRLGWKHWYGTGGDHHYDTPIYDDAGNLDTRFFGKYGAFVRTELAVNFVREKKEKPWLLQLNYSEPHVATMPALYQMPATREYVRTINRKLELGLSEKILNNPSSLSFYDTLPQHLLTQLLPQSYLDLYDPEYLRLDPNVPERWKRVTRLFLQEYYAMISCIDGEIGKLMDVLKETGQLQRTIVIFTSDHGDMLSNGYLRFKGVPYQNAFRTPLIVAGPGVRKGYTDTLVSSVDMMPTLLELSGLKKPEILPGVSVAADIFGQEECRQNAVLLGLATWRGIYDGRYFYAVDNRSGAIRPIRLIDTQQDPYDMNNLNHFESYEPLRKRMHSLLVEKLLRVKDCDFLACEYSVKQGENRNHIFCASEL
ncbi:MAG: sulfatase-like hydrolase/transferase [Eubacteriales bacterium]|nr:sulfatase-like hydrolase/transferase [Eubacteriales bacterium]